MASNPTRGLAYETVKNIADKLVAEGAKVARITYREILAHTKTGSLQTIGEHLHRYRLEYIETVAEDDVDLAELEEFAGPIREIVARKVRKANQRRDVEQAGEREHAETQRENLAFALAQNDALTGELVALRERERALNEQVAAAAKTETSLLGKLDEARARYDDLVARLFPLMATKGESPSSTPVSNHRSPGHDITAAAANLAKGLHDRGATEVQDNA